MIEEAGKISLILFDEAIKKILGISLYVIFLVLKQYFARIFAKKIKNIKYIYIF